MAKVKYKKGDKVVIRNDLIADEVYGNWFWFDEMEYLKQKEYVVIEKLSTDGGYYVDTWFINEKMISHKYKEQDDDWLEGLSIDDLNKLKEIWKIIQK